MDVTYGQVEERMGFHPADTDLKRKGHEVARELSIALARVYVDLLPPGREKSLACTSLQEALMWGNAALAIGGGPVPNTVDKLETIADDFGRHYGVGR